MTGTGALRFAAIMLSAAALALSGCATNSLRVDRATALGAAARVAETATSELFDQVNAANRTTAIEIATLDPACRLPEPLIASSDTTAPSAFICRDGPKLRGDFALRRLDRRAFLPSLAVVTALTDYLAVLDAIVSAKPVDAGAVFTDAEGKLNAVSDGLTAISGSTAFPKLTTDQSDAVASALTLFGTIAQEAREVSYFKRLERDPAQQARFKATTAALRKADATWVRVLAIEVAQQQGIADTTRLLAAASYPQRHSGTGRSGPVSSGSSGSLARARLPPLTLTEMRELRRRQMDLIDRAAAIEGMGPAMAKTVDVLEQAHADYLDLLFHADAKLSREERRRKARVIETRVVAALRAVAALAKSF